MFDDDKAYLRQRSKGCLMIGCEVTAVVVAVCEQKTQLDGSANKALLRRQKVRRCEPRKTERLAFPSCSRTTQ